MTPVKVTAYKNTCNVFRSTMYAEEQCEELDGIYNMADKSCYYNGSQDNTACRYYANLKCYPHVDSSYTASTCANIGGFYAASNTPEQPGSFCYYKQFNCTLHPANNQCYSFKTSARNQTKCIADGGFYQHGYCYNECPATKYLFNDVCYEHRAAYPQQKCVQLRGYFDAGEKYCYYGDYCVSGHVENHICYPFVDSSYTSSTCTNIGGIFVEQGEFGRCYYIQFNCTFHAVNGQCYRVKSAMDLRAECDSVGGHYKSGHCYYECPATKYLFNDVCYEHRAAYPQQKCTQLRGYFDAVQKYCYYNDYCFSGHVENHMCYPFVDSSYTASTCTNIGGVFVEQGQFGRCYYIDFNCSFHAVNGQCYRVKSAMDHRAECESVGGHYKSGHCYYECPATKYLIGDHCYSFRSANYTQAHCQLVGGQFAADYCYIDRCNYSSINNYCYRYKSASYSKNTCINIGGSYAAESANPHQYYCYYTSFDCRLHAINGQCYSRSSNYSQPACETVPDSYYDISSSTCYFHCTEMPKLGRCFAAYNSSLTKERCATIGGTYFNLTCYYVTSYCPAHLASNGQCYSSRSAALTCDTCRNIGGHLQNEVCYYHRNHCSMFAIDGQCYSNRSSIHTANSCADVDGLYHDGYCYYEAERCRSSHYRNCSCFQNRTVSKTAGTCANIGGYYDWKMGQCYFNSTTCAYYDKNSQCYRHRSLGFSWKTCSSIRGYFSDEQDGTGETVSACFYNKLYYNCTETPQVSACVVAQNSAFSRETCELVGGVYSNLTCYYTTLKCLLYNTSDGRCYSNRSAVLTCNTCQNIGGHYENGFCYYIANNCSTYRIGEQCYTHRSSGYSANGCFNVNGFFSVNYCYYEASKCRTARHYINCTCFTSSTRSKTAGTCANIGGYYDFDSRICYHNSSSNCPYYNRNSQCYRYRNSNFLQETCEHIRGYYARETDESGQSRYACYFNEFSCSNWANDQCYSSFSSSYNEGSCASRRGYYSQSPRGCYYHRSGGSCTYSRAGQCYDRYYSGWSRDQCDAANGFFEEYYGGCRHYSYRCKCYINNYYCPSVVSSVNKCYSYTSSLYDCTSCRLLDGFLYSGTCYSFLNCSSPLFLASNGQCYGNSTAVSAASECATMPGEAFYSDGLCYFSVGSCLPGYDVNCQCYAHRATIYSAGTCGNIGGYYVNGTGRCYYNSSHCPDRYHSIDGECYRQTALYSRSTCRNIGGHYSRSASGGICYYDSFNCSGFVVDGRSCFMNRSANFSRATCRNIGGIYGYHYSGRHYRSSGGDSSRQYHCLYDTFNCAW